MKQILIPTDFSDNSWNAIEYTLAFFENTAVHIHLLHIHLSGSVEDDRHLYINGLSLMEDQIGGKREQLLEWKERLETLFTNPLHQFDATVKHSFFIDGIKKAISEKNIDLIVMGTKGASGLKEATIGSYTGAVITRVQCPILVIPENAVFQNPQNIAFPTDFNLPYKNRIIATLLDIASIHDSSLKVLRVANEDYALNNQQEENRRFLIDALENTSYSLHWIKSPGLEEGLQTFIDLMEIQIIAMVAKNLNFFQRLLFKPTVAKISYHTEIPFLVLHE